MSSSTFHPGELDRPKVNAGVIAADVETAPRREAGPWATLGGEVPDG